MAHNIEIDELTGMAKFASRRQPAWHMLGTVHDEDFMTPTDLAGKAGILGMNVHIEDWSNLEAGDIKGGSKVAGKVTPDYDYSEPFLVTVRTNPATKRKEVIEKVGGNYHVIQTEDMVSLADVYSEEYKASAETAGSLRNGRAVFLSLSMDRQITLDPQGAADKINTYLLFTNSFDGSVGFGGLNTPVRVVCQNTLNMAMHGVQQSFTIRHTKTAQDRIEQAKLAAQVNAAYMERFEKAANTLYETKMTDKVFWGVIEAYYGDAPGDDSSPQTVTKWANNVADVMSLWHGQTVAGAGIGRTGWGALNAITENDQWLRQIRTENPESFVMAGAGFRGDVNNKRTKVLDIISEKLDIKV